MNGYSPSGECTLYSSVSREFQDLAPILVLIILVIYLICVDILRSLKVLYKLQRNLHPSEVFFLN